MTMAWYVIRRELSAQPRRKWFYLKRTGIVILGAVIILWGLCMSRLTQSTTMGLEIFMSLSMSMLFAVCLLAPATAYSLIMREKEERTLGLLLLSDITSGQLLLGKLLTGLFSTVMAILSVLPLFALTVSLGGVSTGQILSAFALLLANVFLGACMGLFISSVVGTDRHARGILALTLLGFYLFLPLGAAWLFATRFEAWRITESVVCVLSPFYSMGVVISGRQSLTGLWNCGVDILLGFAFLGLAAWLLPRRAISREKPALRLRLRDALRSGRHFQRWRPPSASSDNPVAWRDFHFLHGGQRGVWLKFALATAAIALCALWGALKTNRPDFETVSTIILWILMIFSAAVFGLASLSHAGMAFNREHKSRTFEMLLTTTLENEEIVRGKIKSVFLSVLPWLIGAVVCALLLLLLHHDIRGNDFASLFYIVLEYLAMWYGYWGLAFWLSLRFRKNVAFGVCILTFILWNSLGRMIVGTLLFSIMALGRSGSLGISVMIVFDIVVHLALGALCFGAVFTKFRATALREET